MEPITLTYALTLEDLEALNRAASARQRALWPARLKAGFLPGALIGLPFGMLAAAAARFWDFDGASLMIGALGACLAILTAFWVRRLLLSKSAMRALFPSDVAMMEARTCTIGPGGVTSKGARFTDTWAWGAVVDIVRAPAHVFVFLSPVQAVVLPARALPEGMTLEDLEARLRALRSAAGP